MTAITNEVRDLDFAHDHLVVKVVSTPRVFHLADQGIVVNPTRQDVRVEAAGANVVQPFSSQTLRDVTMTHDGLLIIVEPPHSKSQRTIIEEAGWMHHSDILAGARPDPGPSLPLWRSPQFEIGTIEFNPGDLPGQTDISQPTCSFLIRLSLWFAHAGTDCGIHNQHDFMEIHTQVAGSGRMQKFRMNDSDSLYQDEPMTPGYTTSVPYCQVLQPDRFEYPWHRYYAESDCLWMAIEYCPARTDGNSSS